MEATNPNSKSIYYPPGGMLIWIVIYLELVTFGMGIAALAYYGAADRAAYHESAQLLSRPMATINTLLLLTSGFMVAKGVHFFKQGLSDKAGRWLMWALLSGAGFLVVKGLEYYLKIQAGTGMDFNSFFMFYWLLTGFHYIHVLVGIVILFVIRRGIIKKKTNASLEDLEAGAAFWHMCDLIWLLLFPVLYLLF